MRLLILADIHANAPALKAVLDKARAFAPDAIVSLGDHLNYGPMPKETLALLKDCKARLLLGNHEERIVRLRSGDRELAENYNWSMLRWTSMQVQGESLQYPPAWQVGDSLFTHAVPGDISRLVRSCQTGEMEAILSAMPWHRLIAGHNHAPWRYSTQDKEFVCPGSVGMLEDGKGAKAAYATFADDRVEMHAQAYDLAPMKRAYVKSGLAKAAPELARVMLQVIREGTQELALTFMEAAKCAAADACLPPNSREAFRLAAQTFPWTEDLTCEEFWNRP